MLNFDFSTYINSFIDDEEMESLVKKKDELFIKLVDDKMSSWYKNKLSDDILNKIKETSNIIKNNTDVFIVIGIGGSYMGSYALHNLFLPSFQKTKPEIIYLGNNLSQTYLDEVLDYIKTKKITVNAISKSGNTLEVKLIYDIMKKYIYDNYSKDEAKRRIIITTNSNDGYLKEEALQNDYTLFTIPEKIGGRYSIMTAAHLLPLSVAGFDIDEFINGYYSGKKYMEESYKYACIRKLMFDKEKYIENYCVYEPKMYYYTEFLKQLFAESEGKDEKGILPISTVNTRDLHSLGQFLQEGNKIVFETVLSINSDISEKESLHYYNKIIEKSVIQSHYSGKVPNIIIKLKKYNENTFGQLTMFFFMAAAFSSYLFDVNPYDQPGVENYKRNVRKNINI